MRKMIAGVTLALVASMSVTACGNMPQACSNLSVSAQDREAAANGYEVEKVDSMGNECELSQDGQSWSVDE